MRLLNYGLCVLFLCLLSTPVFSKSLSQTILEEDRILELEKVILANANAPRLLPDEASICIDEDGQCANDASLFLQALSNTYVENQITEADLQVWLLWMQQNVTETHFFIAAWNFRNVFPDIWLQQKTSKSKYAGNDKRIIYILNRKNGGDSNDYVALARDLVSDNSSSDRLRLFLICRNDRIYPCIFVARDQSGNLLLKNNKIWSQPALAFSRHNKFFDEFNGNTPSGVYTIDGVMPYADRPVAFGQYRRLILNFIPESAGEELTLGLLPNSSESANWWHEAVIARDMGRNSFRIHGTGTEAPVGEPYYPFFGTSGCIAKRENTYDGIAYRDQRLLLDELMLALGLKPTFENEVNIKAYLYVININNEQKAVGFDDLVKLKIIKN